MFLNTIFSNFDVCPCTWDIYNNFLRTCSSPIGLRQYFLDNRFYYLDSGCYNNL